MKTTTFNVIKVIAYALIHSKKLAKMAYESEHGEFSELFNKQSKLREHLHWIVENKLNIPETPDKDYFFLLDAIITIFVWPLYDNEEEA